MNYFRSEIKVGILVFISVCILMFLVLGVGSFQLFHKTRDFTVYFNFVNGKQLSRIFNGLKARVLVLAFKSDWLYPAYQSREIVKACTLAEVNTTYCEINSNYGHDAFLLEIKEESHVISHFLKSVFNEQVEH